MKPVVSINLCCYNSEKYLEETLQSIIGQTFKNWELVIVNDGSADSTEVIIFKYRDLGYPIVYHFQQNRGLAASRNKAIELSHGDYIAFIDHDDIWMPEMLERQLAVFDEKTVLVYGNFVTRDMLSGKEYMSFDPDREFYSGRVTGQLCKKNFVFIESAVAKTDSVRKLGEPFDPLLLIYDDMDFLLRLSLTGDFKFTDYVTCVYRMHPANLTMTRNHYLAHDLSYRLFKYRGMLGPRMLRDIARQYILTVRMDLNYAGFRVFPFLLLGCTPKHIGISLLLPFTKDRNILEVKAALLKPVRYLHSIFKRRKSPGK